MAKSGSNSSRRGGRNPPSNTPIINVVSQSTTDQLLPYREGGVERCITYTGNDIYLYPGEIENLGTGLKLEMPASITAMLHPFPPLAQASVIMPDAPQFLCKENTPREVQVRLLNVGQSPILIYNGETIALMVFHRLPTVNVRYTNVTSPASPTASPRSEITFPRDTAPDEAPPSDDLEDELSDSLQINPLVEKIPVIELAPLAIIPLIRTEEERATALANYRKEQRDFADFPSEKYTRTLGTLGKLNTENNSRRNDNLMKLLGNKYYLMNCYEKVKGNAGALTPGTDKATVDEMSEAKFEEAASEIRKGSYIFGKSRRIYVEKPGKKKKRPITIPNAMNKVVQEGIRVILNVIYEPLFKLKSWNYGFRPGVSCIDAIQAIKIKAKGSDFALEGDIDGAFDNVLHDVMIKFLGERISDKKFLALIKQLHKSGIMVGSVTQDTTLGIPQGGIASPILFNIYMYLQKSLIFEDI